MERLEIDIKDTGVFCPGFKGAIGKTYIGILSDKENQLLGNNDIRFITYNSANTEDVILLQIAGFDGKYLFLDRFDLYISDTLVDAVLSKSKSCSIILDLKSESWWRKFPVKFVSITRSREGVSVRQRW